MYNNLFINSNLMGDQIVSDNSQETYNSETIFKKQLEVAPPNLMHLENP